MGGAWLATMGCEAAIGPPRHTLYEREIFSYLIIICNYM